MPDEIITQSTGTAEDISTDAETHGDEQSQETTQVETPETKDQTGSEDAQGEEEQTTEVELPEGVGSKEEWLNNLIQKGEDDPKVEYTDKELDILDEYYNGKLKPKQAESEEEKSKKDESDEEPEKKEEAKKQKPEKKEKAEEQKPDLSSLDHQIMKEIGAKSKTEILEKIKGLRKAVSGKVEVAPEFVQMKKDHDVLTERMANEVRLWDDYRAGKPEAIDFVKKNYIPDTPAADQKKSDNKGDDRVQVDEEEFIDRDGAANINKVLNTLYDKIDKQESRLAGLIEDAEAKRTTLETRTVENKIIDEMVQVSEGIPNLSKISNIREAIVKWYKKEREDPRMEYFNDLFEIANKQNVDLVTASEIDKGRKSDLKIVQAKDVARKEVYDRKPNRSLSEVQGKQGDFHQYSDAEIQDMVYGKTQMPDSWFNEKDQPVPSRIPKRAHKYFGFPAS